MDLNLTCGNVDSTTIATKKCKSAIPNGLLEGFVPAALKSRLASDSEFTSTAATSSRIEDESAAEFNMGGFEDLNGDGTETSTGSTKYPKYAGVNAKGTSGIQVRALNIQAAFVTATVDSNVCRPGSK